MSMLKGAHGGFHKHAFQPETPFKQYLNHETRDMHLFYLHLMILSTFLFFSRHRQLC